ncbi:RICIN domain-containing protein [Streptomyces rubellomurinus]|uniref:RICIN domain-containing protein n=1 Tax=Streptomyces sp. Y1 TaxID=3238634 RepID=A0AB39TQT9_9ACTN|nr:RICIN domain-containing protein [Streptomyces rubellomurinus]
MRIRTTVAALATAAALAVPLLPTAAQADAPAGSSDRLTLGQKAARSAQHGTGPAPAIAPGYIRIHSLYQYNTGQCLDADAEAGGNGTRVQVWGCNGQSQQEWLSRSDGSLENVRFPGMCLDADTGRAGGNGTWMQLWQCTGGANQKWFTRANDPSIYNQAYNNNLNTVVDRDTGWGGDGASAQLWQKVNQSQQWWQIVPA